MFLGEVPGPAPRFSPGCHMTSLQPFGVRRRGGSSRDFFVGRSAQRGRGGACPARKAQGSGHLDGFELKSGWGRVAKVKWEAHYYGELPKNVGPSRSAELWVEFVKVF